MQTPLHVAPQLSVRVRVAAPHDCDHAPQFPYEYCAFTGQQVFRDCVVLWRLVQKQSNVLLQLSLRVRCAAPQVDDLPACVVRVERAPI